MVIPLDSLAMTPTDSISFWVDAILAPLYLRRIPTERINWIITSFRILNTFASEWNCYKTGSFRSVCIGVKDLCTYLSGSIWFYLNSVCFLFLCSHVRLATNALVLCSLIRVMVALNSLRNVVCHRPKSRRVPDGGTDPEESRFPKWDGTRSGKSSLWCILVRRSSCWHQEAQWELIKHRICIAHLHLLHIKPPCIQKIMTDAKQACGTVQASHCRTGKMPGLPTEPNRTLQAGLVGLPRDATQSHWSHLKVAFF